VRRIAPILLGLVVTAHARADVSAGADPAQAAVLEAAPLEAHRLIDANTCLRLLPALTQVSRCWLGRSAGGRAALVWVERGCAGERCNRPLTEDDDRVWILTPAHPPRALPSGLGWDGATIRPSLVEAIVDDGRGHLVRVDLRRGDLAAGERFAGCSEPVQSPGGRWIVCRNRQADVLRVPIAGGRLERVYRRRTFFYPGRHGTVEFTSPERVEVPVNETGDSGSVESIGWRE
jgi:hypothetical protein